MKNIITEEIKKKLEELRDKLDSGKSSEPKLGDTQLTLELKEDF